MPHPSVTNIHDASFIMLPLKSEPRNLENFNFLTFYLRHSFFPNDNYETGNFIFSVDAKTTLAYFTCPSSIVAPK